MTVGTSMRSVVSPASDLLLERLAGLHPKLIDLSLGRIERLLARLGHPERALPPVVHVAGTNGKGSVIAYLRAMLEAAGYGVQVYTSPHLVRFHERIRLAGHLIEEAELAELLEEVERVNGGEPITFFEVTTAAAFLAFARQPADLLLLEVGLGGRLDATNLVERPLLTAITPVSLDHMQHLGDSLAAIAGEKAGILKPGVACILGPQQPEALAAIEARAADVGAPLSVAGRDWTFEITGEGFVLTTRKGRGLWPRPALLGPHQVENAATALVAAEALEEVFRLDPEAKRTGLAAVEWPARLQCLTRGPLAALLPPGFELWLDGGHNESAGRALAETLRAWNDRPLYLLYGMLNSKAAERFLAPLAPFARGLAAVRVPGEPASLTAEEAAAHAANVGLPAVPAPSLEAALTALLAQAEGPSRILICGSLYLAGRVLAENG